MGLCIAGATIDDPMSIWRAYAHRYSRTIRDYDLGGHGNPNSLTADEAWRSRIINSRLTEIECEELVARAAERACPWNDVPVGASLAAADPAAENGTFDKAAKLYWYFTWPERIRGVRVATVHKVLHLKRPAMYPILDGKVRRIYREGAERWVSELSRLDLTIEDSPPYWAAIRQDLLCNNARLDRYRQDLAEERGQNVASMAQLNNLRLQDIVTWWIAD